MSKKLIISVTVLFFLFLTSAFADENFFIDAGFLKVKQEISAPEFKLSDLNDNVVKLSDHKDKTVLLFFWTTWWTWCKKEVPSLINIYEKYKDKGFVILAINIKEKRKTVNKYAQKSKIPFPILLDVQGKVATQYGARGTPSHFFVNQYGMITAAAIGYKDFNNKSVEKLIEHLIEK